jgi:hypothetical protein
LSLPLLVPVAFTLASVTTTTGTVLWHYVQLCRCL